jgi:hypothetical protein
MAAFCCAGNAHHDSGELPRRRFFPADLDAGVIKDVVSHVIGLQLLYLYHQDTRQVPLRYWEDKRPQEIMREG